MRVLVVEDEPTLAEQLAEALRDAGYAVDIAADGEEAGFLGETEPYDAAVLDLGLPRQDGLSVLGSWRQAGVSLPVLVLTARDSWSDKLAGFNAGADDYVVKPFHMQEVLVRVAALIRRAAGHAQPVLRCGPLSYDSQSGAFELDARPLKLTAYEARILAYLLHHNGRIVSRSELTEHVYAQDFDRDSNSIEVLIARLRKKIGAELIQTLRGRGYRLREPAGAAGK